MIVNLTEENFEQVVLQSDVPVLVDFFATWCGPCQMLAPELAALDEENQGDYVIGKVNVDQQQALAVKYNVQGLPTMLLFQAGEVVETVLGPQPRTKLRELLQQPA